MPSVLLDSQQQLTATCGWGSLYPVEEPVKPRHLLPVPAAAAAAKKPAYGGRKKNLETCTEALGCETGGVDGCDGGGVEAEFAERKRRAREEEEMATEESASLSARRGRGPLPPPLTTLARGSSRVRLVHERRGGRLEVYAVRSPGILEAERGGGRLRLSLLPLLRGAAECCCQQGPEAEKEEAKETDEEECGFAKYVRGGRRCVDLDGGVATPAAVRGKQWEPKQAATFWVATS